MSSGETENKKMKTQYLYHKASNFVLKWDNLSVTYGAYLMSLVAVVLCLKKTYPNWITSLDTEKENL